jgi:hypothetical protein
MMKYEQFNFRESCIVFSVGDAAILGETVRDTFAHAIGVFPVRGPIRLA